MLQLRDGSFNRIFGKPRYFHAGFGGFIGFAFFASGFGISAFSAEVCIMVSYVGDAIRFVKSQGHTAGSTGLESAIVLKFSACGGEVEGRTA